jgi:pyruvate,water dikinase
MQLKMIRFFDKIGKDDISIAGGKAANLGELTKAGFNVPHGFVVTTKAYDNFVEISELKKDMAEQLEKLDMGDHELVEKISKELKRLIMDEEVFEDLVTEINNAMKKLKGERFAVRSSATAEDLITASFAGQQDTYLNVSRKDIVASVKKCWASLFNPRAIYYRHEKNIPHDVEMAVVIQEMVDAEFAGVMFTVDPIKKRYILVEAAPGLGEKVVSGTVTPNSYMLDKESLEVKEENISYEMDESIIKKIAELGLQIEKHYRKPQDIEFAVKKGEISILQSRAITTL